MSWIAIGLAAALAAPAQTTQIRKEIEFLGFSDDESVSVWHVEVTATRDVRGGRYEDRYGLVRLVDSVSRDPIATFRDEPIRRRHLSGRRQPFSAADLHAANPEWGKARSRRQWLRVRNRHRFDAMLLSMKDSTVRLLLDEDLHLDATAEDEHIEVVGRLGEAIGFQPVARLMDGRHISLGHFRSAGIDGEVLRATVEVYHGPTARHVAVLCHFHPEGKPHLATSMAAVGRTPQEPLGTNAVGTVEMMRNVVRTGGNTFAHVLGGPDPKVMRLYDYFVGRKW